MKKSPDKVDVFTKVLEQRQYNKKIKLAKEKSLENSRLFLNNYCGRWDLNPHAIAGTRSLVLPVCQFQHFRICLVCTAQE